MEEVGGTGAPEDRLGLGREPDGPTGESGAHSSWSPSALAPSVLCAFYVNLEAISQSYQAEDKADERTGWMDGQTDLQFKGGCLGPCPVDWPHLLLPTAPLFLEGPGSFWSP